MRQPSSSCSIRLQINTAPFHHALRRVGLLLCGPSSRSPTPWVVGLAPIRYPRRACIGSPPSGRTSVANGLSPFAVRRTAANRIDVAARLSVRTTAACRLFPSGEALPSTTSAGSCLPLFGRFLGTTTSSDFSSAYMLGVQLLPSRAGPAQDRARVRPPRFRAKNFSTCTRSPTARGSPMQANTPWTMLPSLQQYEIGTSELDPFRSSILGPWSPL